MSHNKSHFKIVFIIEHGWESFQLTASEEYIIHGKDDAILHQSLLDEWSDILNACTKKKSANQQLQQWQRATPLQYVQQIQTQVPLEHVQATQSDLFYLLSAK